MKEISTIGFDVSISIHHISKDENAIKMICEKNR